MDAAVDMTPACPIPYPDESLFGREVGTVIDPKLSLIDEKGRYTLRSLYAPCAKEPQLLVMRLTLPWCGPCRWQAQHTGELLQSEIGSRLQIVDVIVRNEQNRPAEVADLASFRKQYDQVPWVTASDVAPRLTHYVDVTKDGEMRFPIVVVLNKQTMRLLGKYSNPDPDYLLGQLRTFVARADGLPDPPVTPVPLYDDRFTRDRWQLIQQMQLAADWEPPADPTNRVESSAAAATLGQKLFLDASLSKAGTIGCFTCHRPGLGFIDRLPTSKGIDPAGKTVLGDRNSPSLVGLQASRFMFWDGRIDSVWAQALGPFENDKEMSSNRMHVVRTSLARYQPLYEAVFGAAPDFSDTTRFPQEARPGLDSWEHMTAADQQLVSRTFANLGKAIAAFERRVRPLPTALDRYAAGDKTALTDNEKDGLVRFFEVGCIQCHYGPQLTDGTFHANYFRSGNQDGSMDYGRSLGIEKLLANEFRGNGPFSDAPLSASWLNGLKSEPTDVGQFRTMTLRGVADTAPYTHGGQTTTLEELVALYARGGQPDGDPMAVGIRDLTMVTFPEKDPRNDLLVQFLRTLTADFELK